MKSILDKDFVYTNAAQTDITQVWRKHGWKPRNEILHELPSTSADFEWPILLGRKDKTLEMQALHKNNI
jgi:hypothetical protein